MTITKHTTEHGYYFRYDHPRGEPPETLSAAIIMAKEVAADQARKEGKTYYLTSLPKVTSIPGPVSLYILRSDHPELLNPVMDVIVELTPKGKLALPSKPLKR